LTKNNDISNNTDGLKSILVCVKNKSSKKSVSWKPENVLVEISYFEHDETERGILYRIKYFLFK